MPAPKTPKKEKSTEARTYDPEPMKGLSPERKMSSDSEDEYSPVKSVDLGEQLTESEKADKASISARQEEVSKAIGRAMGGKSRRRHKKAKKARKTRKVKKHGKRRH